MAIKSTADLLIEANLIKNATVPGENTALRVGGTLVDMIDSQLILPPKPIITTDGNNLNVHFMDQGFDFSVGNPELFLFRYRGRRVSRYSLGNKVKRASYVHPCTVNALTKWAGWKFFSGQQFIRDGSYINTRITEWAITPTLKPYEKMQLTGFNKYMFWYEYDLSAPPSVIVNQYDVNIFSGSPKPYVLDSRVNANNSNLFSNLGGTASPLGTSPVFGKITCYAFAVGIDNPNATKTNGLCPKIFGPMSDDINAILKVDNAVNNGDIYDVSMVANCNNVLGRAARPAKFSH